MMTPSSHNTANTINFTFGSENMTWTTTTRDFATCPIESQNLVFNIPDSDMQNGASYEGQ